MARRVHLARIALVATADRRQRRFRCDRRLLLGGVLQRRWHQCRRCCHRGVQGPDRHRDQRRRAGARPRRGCELAPHPGLLLLPGRMDDAATPPSPRPNRLDGWIVQFGGNAGAVSDTDSEKVKVCALRAQHPHPGGGDVHATARVTHPAGHAMPLVARQLAARTPSEEPPAIRVGGSPTTCPSAQPVRLRGPPRGPWPDGTDRPRSRRSPASSPGPVAGVAPHCGAR